MQLLKGDTLTIGITLGTYDQTGIVDKKLAINVTEYDIDTDDEMLLCRLSSEETAALGAGKHKVVLCITDSILGLKKHPLGEIEILKTGAQKSNKSVNLAYDIVYNLTITETAITVNSILYNYVKGSKGDTFEYEDFTLEQLEALKVKGDKGDDFVYEDFTEEQLTALITSHSHAPISLTYSALYALKTAGTLVVGQRYIITDYQTVHTIPNTTDTNTGIVEPLMVTALTTNKLAAECHSTLFPNDILYYDIENEQTMVPGCTKGYIYRRIDTLKNNDIGFDFRNVKFRRWQMDIATVHADGDDASLYKGNVVKKTGTVEVYVKLCDAPGLFSNESFWKRFEWDNLQYILPTENDWTIIDDAFQVNLPNSELYHDFYMFSNVPTVTGVQSSFDSIYDNKIEQNNSNILNVCNSVIFGANFNSNSIGANFSYNSIGANFSYNSIGVYFNSNSIGANFNSNSIGANFNYNSIGANFSSNSIGANFSFNSIGAYFNSNSIGVYFNSNSIGVYFFSNSIGVYFYSNSIGANFNYNSIGAYFNSNSIGVYFNSNSIGVYFNSNSIGANFQMNRVEDNVNRSQDTIDFTSATYCYLGYSKTIFINSNSYLMLSYFNELNVLAVVSATA